MGFEKVFVTKAETTAAQINTAIAAGAWKPGPCHGIYGRENRTVALVTLPPNLAKLNLRLSHGLGCRKAHRVHTGGVLLGRAHSLLFEYIECQ